MEADIFRLAPVPVESQSHNSLHIEHTSNFWPPFLLEAGQMRVWLRKPWDQSSLVRRTLQKHFKMTFTTKILKKKLTTLLLLYCLAVAHHVPQNVTLEGFDGLLYLPHLHRSDFARWAMEEIHMLNEPLHIAHHILNGRHLIVCSFQHKWPPAERTVINSCKQTLLSIVFENIYIF